MSTATPELLAEMMKYGVIKDVNHLLNIVARGGYFMHITPPTDIATMPIADKVHRHVNASYYKVLLASLQDAAREVGSCFSASPFVHYMPADIEEHLAFNLAIARVRCMNPNETIERLHIRAEEQMDDGFALQYLRDIIAALEAMNLRWQIQSREGLDREGYIKARERRKNMGLVFPSEATNPAPATTPSDEVALLAEAFCCEEGSHS